MKRVALIFIFLCLFLLLFKGRAYTQGTTQVDLSKLLDQYLLFGLPNYPVFPASYTSYQWPPSQPIITGFPTIPNMSNYSFLFGNNWYLWQMYGLNAPLYLSSSQKKKSESSKKEEQTILSTYETTLDSTIKFSASADKSVYDKAESIGINLMLENNGPEEVIIEFPSEQKFNVMVKNKSGEIVRQFSSEILDIQPSTTLALQPDQTETFYIRWNQEDYDGMIVPSGTYTIDATLSATDAEYQKTVSFNISIGDLPRFKSCKELKETLKKFWDEFNPPSSSGGDETSETPSKGKVRAPSAYAGYYGAYYGGYGMISGPSAMAYGVTPSYLAAPTVFAPSYNLAAFAPGITQGISGFTSGYGYAPNYALPALTSTYGGGFGVYAPSLGISYGNLLPGSFTGYSAGYNSYGSLYGAGYTRFKTTSDGPDGDTGNSNSGYSLTNVQVMGVDEADIIKNDGTYIYMIKGKSVLIIQGFPADAMQIKNVISLENYTDFKPKGLYVMGNTMALIGDQPVPSDSYYSIPPPGTRIFIYDITDRTNEILARKFIFWGEYVQSRGTAETLYVIMNEPAPLTRFEGTLTDPQVLIPHFYDSHFNANNEDDEEIMCNCDEVAYLPEYSSPNYLVVIGIPLDDHSKAIGREVILGKSDQVYATTENLYVTSEYNNGHPTNIYKFWLNHYRITYGSNAQVSGRVINQFSMDEYEDHLRIATTSVLNSQAENNIHIFDSGMKKTGSLEDFTSGGGIQSIRFDGDRCYAVVSGNINPLCIVSLTDTTNPTSLGFLNILSGAYYLHPIDKNLLLGFGREIDGISENGVKVSLYDMTDIGDPREIGEDEIGSDNTESEVLTDHKALLLSMEKNLMAFPVTVTEENVTLPYTFQGAYVYHIDDNGFERIEEGITHYPGGTFPRSSYDDTSPYHISRIIYMGDYCYTVSKNRITARDILIHTETYSLYLE